jgi:hypothetical protein
MPLAPDKRERMPIGLQSQTPKQMNPIIKNLISFRLIYILVGGFFFYLSSATFDAIFIPTLELEDGWCQEWAEIKFMYRSKKRCVKFKNEVEAFKYRHNQRMDKRESHKTFTMFLVATLVTFSLMMLKPSLFFGKDTALNNYTGTMATAVYYGTILGFIIPIIFQQLLPPATQWFPDEFQEIRQARIAYLLKENVELSHPPVSQGVAQ